MHQDFRLVQNQTVCRQQITDCSSDDPCLLFSRQHCWKKEKMLAISIFSYSHIAIETFLPQGCSKLGLCGKDLILDWSKLKRFPDDKINASENWKFVLERVENIVEKGKDAGYQHFLLFPQCFQKASFPRPLKDWIAW